MEENVALDSNKQKQFVKSIKGIKKLINRNEKKADGIIEATTKKSKRRMKRGLVYLSHIPHGFYEHQMTQYFKQFGVVTNARVIRSKRTGNSRGFAFVEFKEPAVGEIVAETMNNYLMGKRLIKAVYITPEKQRRQALRKHWNQQSNPGRTQKLKMKRSYNSIKNSAQDVTIARKLMKNLTKTKKKLNEMGIDYDFFTPVDVPESLQSDVSKTGPENSNEKDNNKKSKQKDTTENKKDGKVKTGDVKVKKADKQKNKAIVEIVKDTKQAKIADKQKNKAMVETVKDTKQAKIANKQKNKAIVETVKNTKQAETKAKPKVEEKKAEIEKASANQKNKRKDLKKIGVTPLEDFIEVKSDVSDSDGSLEFDSDEYDKIIDDDDEFGSDVSDESGENDDSEDEESEEGEGEVSGEASDSDESGDEDASDDDDEELSEEESEPVVVLKTTKKNKKPEVKPVQNIKANKNGKGQQKNTNQGQKNTSQQQVKRKAERPTANETKKFKFEKQTKQVPTNKMFKKKK